MTLEDHPDITQVELRGSAGGQMGAVTMRSSYIITAGRNVPGSGRA